MQGIQRSEARVAVAFRLVNHLLDQLEDLDDLLGAVFLACSHARVENAELFHRRLYEPRAYLRDLLLQVCVQLRVKLAKHLYGQHCHVVVFGLESHLPQQVDALDFLGLDADPEVEGVLRPFRADYHRVHALSHPLRLPQVSQLLVHGDEEGLDGLDSQNGELGEAVGLGAKHLCEKGSRLVKG